MAAPKSRPRCRRHPWNACRRSDQQPGACRANLKAKQIIENLRNNFNEVLRAYNENRGRRGPVSLNATDSLTLAPVPGVYTKPLIVLTDEFSASGSDMFPAMIQDNNPERAPA